MLRRRARGVLNGAMVAIERFCSQPDCPPPSYINPRQSLTLAPGDWPMPRPALGI